MRVEREYRRIRVSPMTGALGAEIEGVDTSTPMDAEQLAEVRQAFQDHLVLVFRDQDMNPQRMDAFARQFGDLDRTNYAGSMKEGDTYTGSLVRAADAGVKERNNGDYWHLDQTIRPRPNKAFVLYSALCPPYGGDTMFANLYQAYEALSDGMQALCDQLIVIHSPSGLYGRDGLGGPGERKPMPEVKRRNQTPEQIREQLASEIEQPLVIQNAETGRKSLYHAGGYLVRFKDMTEDESSPMLEYLHRHAMRPEFTVRLRWRQGTVALIDNTHARHYAVQDYAGFRREMLRVEIAGPEPVGPANEHRFRSAAE